MSVEEDPAASTDEPTEQETVGLDDLAEELSRPAVVRPGEDLTFGEARLIEQGADPGEILRRRRQEAGDPAPSEEEIADFAAGAREALAKLEESSKTIARVLQPFEQLQGLKRVVRRPSDADLTAKLVAFRNPVHDTTAAVKSLEEAIVAKSEAEAGILTELLFEQKTTARTTGRFNIAILGVAVLTLLATIAALIVALIAA